MELENLKHIWAEQATPGTPEPGSEELLALLQKKSHGPVARMRRNLACEGRIILFTYIPTIVFCQIEFKGHLSILSALLFGIGLFFGIYYYRKMQLLNEMQCVSCMVRSNLARQVTTLRKYIRFYLVSGTLILPLTAFLSYIILHWKFPVRPVSGTRVYHLLEPSPWWASPIFWLLLMVPLTIGSYYFNAWYINKLYGRHIKKLQELLREMDEE
jgi:predicted MFS family arabinose efflux permease